jgi:osmotically-inducible protein OsmY
VTAFVVGGATVAVLGRLRHRAMLRDKGVSAGRARDLRHRLRGMVYQAKSRLGDQEVPDDILVERVRAQLGRPVSHPRAIEVRVRNGCVILAGPILADEVEELIRQVELIDGVRSIQSELDLHDEPGDLPALQH